jgi:hypothetical protein
MIMKTLNLFVLLTIVFSLTFSTGCKKDETTEPAQQTAQEFTPKTVKIPDAMAQSNEPGAQQSVAYVNMVNSMSVYGSLLVPPKKSSYLIQKDGGTEVYTWEHNDGSSNYTATLKITETTSYIKWELILNGNLNGHLVNNFTYLKAEEYTDGSKSSFTMYDFDNPGTIVMTINWHESGGTTYFTFEVPQDVIISMEVYADGSGMIEVKEWRNGQYLLDFRAEWTAAGTGEAWEYSNGELVDHTSW